MLRLRGAFDPKRFYKSADGTKFPKYFQMGTVVEGPTDFYSGAWPLVKNLKPSQPRDNQWLSSMQVSSSRAH